MRGEAKAKAKAEREEGGRCEGRGVRAGVINGNTEERKRQNRRTKKKKKMGHHRSHSEAIEGEVMKINTGIITILKIKIENGTLVVSIFKWLRYIDQAQPRFSFFPLLCNLGGKGE